MCVGRWGQANRTKKYMKKINKEVNHLASLAVFRELYDSNKDIYHIISEFIKATIISKGLHKFTINEITSLINKIYDFELPDAVIKTSLNKLKFITKAKGCYTIENINSIENNRLNEIQAENQNKNDLIIEELIAYIEKSTDTKLDDSKRQKTIHSFYSFIINNSNGDFHTEFISSFLIKKKNDIEFVKNLSTIKEGVLLYSGIKFNSNFNDIGSWKSELTIFISTDIIFNLAGYDGEIFKVLFNDFYKFVQEINKSAQKELIKLRYFSDVEQDIFWYFKKAEDIVKGKERLNPSKTAMSSILQGCKSPSDIVERKSDLYGMLEKLNIHKDNYDRYFEEQNHQYNISNLEVIESLTNKIDSEKIPELIKYLNYVKIRRKNYCDKNFENIKYILLTRNSKILKIAWHDEIKGYGEVPLATDLSFLTNKLWFKLNKGFGANSNLVSFDIITKAQIILSSQINSSISQKFDELSIKSDNGELTKEQAIASIAHLRQSVRKPEEIIEEDLQSILDTISEESIDSHLREQEHLRNKANIGVKENEQLKSDLKKKSKQVEQYENSQIELSSEILNTKKNQLKDKEQTIILLNSNKNNLDKEVDKSFFLFKIIVLVLLLGSFTLTNMAIFHFGWNSSEQWTWILTFLFPLFITATYMLFSEKTINPQILLSKVKSRIQQKKYNNSNFDLQKFEDSIKSKEELKVEIELMESQPPTKPI